MAEGRLTALYARVSTEAQREEGYSIDAQKKMLEAYCVSRRIERYEFYVDGGFSGASLERPELSRMTSDISSGLVERVVVYKLDRLSRSQKDTLYLIEDVLNPHGVDFVSLNENMDTSTPIGRAMLGIMSAFAQLERETIRERTRMGMRERVRSGLWMGGGHAPFGYDYDREKGVLVPNSDADTVRRMYELYLSGSSMLAVARAAGLKYERLARQILRRRTNAGYIVYNGEEYRGAHEPIVSEETYERAMELMKRRSVTSAGAKGLLAGMIYCGVCGAKFRYQKWGKSGYKVYCYSQDSSKAHLARGGRCDNHKRWAYELEDIVLSDMFRLAGDAPEEDETLEGGAVESMGEFYEKQYALASKRLKNLYMLYSEDADELLLESINDQKAELERIKKLRSDAIEQENREEALRERVGRLNGLRECWELMSFSEQRALLSDIIDRIVVSYERVDIYYRI